MARSRRKPSRAASSPAVRPSRISGGKVLGELRRASRKGDRAALELALDQMRTLAHSPRYWEKYLGLLRNPLARLVDLLVIKQGDRIAHLKGWKISGAARRRPAEASSDQARGQRVRSKRRSRREPRPVAAQPSLFDSV